MVMAKECLHKSKQFLQFPFLRNQGKPVICNDVYIVHIYHSKHGNSDVEYFEIPYNHSFDKEITAQKQEPPLVPPKKVC